MELKEYWNPECSIGSCQLHGVATDTKCFCRGQVDEIEVYSCNDDDFLEYFPVCEGHWEELKE